jgi:hypothetical protein
MNETSAKDTIAQLVKCLRWEHSSEAIDLLDVSDFMKSISIEEPNPAQVEELYLRYCNAIHATAIELAKKMVG